MKSHIFFRFLLAVLPLAAAAQSRTTIFYESLTGENFKILPTKMTQPHFRLMLSGGIVFPKGSETKTLANALVENQAHPNSQEIILNTGAGNGQRSMEKTFGVAFGCHLSRHLELVGSVGFGSSKVSTSVMVMQPPPQSEWPPHNSEPNIVERVLSAGVLRWQGKAGVAWHFGRGVARPVVGVGWHFTRTSAPDAGYEEKKMGLYAQAGVAFFIRRNLFLNTSFDVHTGISAGLLTTVQSGLGWCF